MATSALKTVGGVVAAAAVFGAVALASLSADRHSAPVGGVTPPTGGEAIAPSPAPLSPIAHGATAVASRPSGFAPEVPARRAPIVARETGKVVYTTSEMGEPMEVYPDGKVIIHDHKKTIQLRDGTTRVILTTVTAIPKSIPREAVQQLAGDLESGPQATEAGPSKTSGVGPQKTPPGVAPPTGH